MKVNMGIADRTVRFVVAVILVTLLLTNVVTGIVGMIFLAIALIFILTAIGGYCPIYGIFGVKRWERE